MTGFIYPMEGNWTWGGESVFGLYSLATTSASPTSPVPVSCTWGASRRAGRECCCSVRARAKYTADGRVNAIPGANLPLATLGTFILWMGWFGFNGGSVLKLATSPMPTRSPWCS